MQDQVNDLAAAPMPSSRDYDIKAVAQENCLRLPELVPSMPCFTVGCPYGLYGVNPRKATPLVLDGVISGVDPDNRKVFTSAPTFPGNSGGPLVVVRVPFDPTGRMTVGVPTVFFAGVMLETRLIPDQNDRVPPLHLGIAAPADAVLDLLESAQARAIADRIATLPSS